LRFETAKIYKSDRLLEPFLAERKMTQKDLADIAGVTPPSVFEWKNEGTLPRADTAIKIADYFNVSVKWLITGVDEIGLTNGERALINGFRNLDERDKEDILGNIEQKIENRKKDNVSYNAEIA
jgi:transcriptional regulator with XRE-family HTH domain